MFEGISILKRLCDPKWLKKTTTSIFYLGTYILFTALTLTACIDEPFATSKTTSLAIRISPERNNTSRLSPGDDMPGEYPDNIVYNIRILAFNRSGVLVSNDRYNIANSALDVIEHPISAGTYDLVFLANEPTGHEVEDENITLSALKQEIAYPATAFGSDKAIPMLQVIENIEISSDGNAELTDGTLIDINGKLRASNPSQGLYEPGDKTDVLTLRLDRLAVRLNIALQSTYNLTEDFESLILSNMPDVVPLFKTNYSGNIKHNE